MELEEIRKEIDLVNADLLKLIEKRMDLVQHVTTYKRQHQLPVHARGRAGHPGGQGQREGGVALL